MGIFLIFGVKIQKEKGTIFLHFGRQNSKLDLKSLQNWIFRQNDGFGPSVLNRNGVWMCVARLFIYESAWISHFHRSNYGSGFRTRQWPSTEFYIWHQQQPQVLWLHPLYPKPVVVSPLSVSTSVLSIPDTLLRLTALKNVNSTALVSLLIFDATKVGGKLDLSLHYWSQWKILVPVTSMHFS